MAIHVCRDFLTSGNPLTYSVAYLNQYYLSIFLRTTLNFSIIGQTNCNIDGSTLKKGSGSGGSINQGTGNEYAFSPNGYTVSSADINRILVLRSPANGMVNSGLFRVTSVDTSNNWFYINYRSGDIPPVESGMTWALYANESIFNSSINSTGNGVAGTYQGSGAATQTRIILQSPSSLNWQVRLSFENSNDCSTNTSPTNNGQVGTSIAPGFGGNSAGDFAPGGQHLHGPQFFNDYNSSHFGTTMGMWPQTNQSRLYMWGDDVTGTVFEAARSVISPSTTYDSFVHFGIPEDEELPLPPHNIQRIFIMGANGSSNGGQNGIYWACGTSYSRAGLTFGLSNQPISCIYSLYNPLFGDWFSGLGGARTIRATSEASDNPYIYATELLPVDLLAGTLDNINTRSPSDALMILEGRRLGRAPLVRLGRSNYGYFQISTDMSLNTWLHLTDGMYMPWYGSILP